MSLIGKPGLYTEDLAKINGVNQIYNYGFRTDIVNDKTDKRMTPAPIGNGVNENLGVSTGTAPNSSIYTRIIAPNMPINGINVTFPTAATTLQLSSTSANDNPAGTGAIAVQISGLDVNYDIITEIVVMNGTSATTATTQEFFRVNQLQVVSAGSTDLNAGFIYCSPSTDTIGGTSVGVPDTTIFNLIKSFTNVSTTALYTVPRGYNYLPNQVQFNSDAQASKTVNVKFWFKLNNLGIPRFEGSQIILQNAVTEFIVDCFFFPEKMDYYVTAHTVSGTAFLKHTVCGVLRKIK